MRPNKAPAGTFTNRQARTAWLALWFVLLCFSLLAVFSVRASAASAEVENVLSQLSTLQNASIDPAWPPDIESNQSNVTALLTAYKALSTAQHAEFSTQQNADLRAYFEALYKVQGRSPAGVDSLFSSPATSSKSPSVASPGAASSQAASVSLPVSSSSEAAAASSSTAYSSAASLAPSSSAAAPSSPSSASLEESSSLADASSSLLPASSNTNSNSLPIVTVFPPQIPTLGGPFSFFGSPSFGNILLLVLFGLCALLFLRFLVAMHTAGPAPGTKRAGRLTRQQAKIAENDSFSPLLPNGAPMDPAFDLESLPPTRTELQEAKRHMKAKRQEQHRQKKQGLPPETPLPAPDPASAADEVQNWTSGHPIDPSEMDAIARLFGDADSPENPLATTQKNSTASPPAADLPPSAAGKTPISAATPKKKGARTGHPNRMRFTQGDAHDIDAIDD